MPINSADLGFKKKIWKAADKLRGNIDASEYKAEEFSKRMGRIMESYRKNQIENDGSLDEFIIKHEDNQIDEVIDELLKMAKDLVKADKLGEEIGLTREETSFYHALTSPDT